MITAGRGNATRRSTFRRSTTLSASPGRHGWTITHSLTPQTRSSSVDDMRPEQALLELLGDLFGFDLADLRRFIAFGEDSDSIMLSLPGGQASFAAVALHAIQLLKGRGLVPGTFQRLRAEFPLRLADIEQAARLWHDGGAAQPVRVQHTGLFQRSRSGEIMVPPFSPGPRSEPGPVPPTAIASYTIQIQGPDRPVEARTFTQAKVILGRDNGDLIVPDALISNVHGEFSFDGSVLHYSDLGSTNGTYAVTGARLADGPVPVGTILRAGNTWLRVYAISPVRPSILCCHARKDRKIVAELLPHLALLERDVAVNIWDDAQILSNRQWRGELCASIEHAAVIVLVVSAEFLASEMLKDEAIALSLAQAEQRGASILLLVIGYCFLARHAVLSRFAAFNAADSPLVALGKSQRAQEFVRLAQALAEQTRRP